MSQPSKLKGHGHQHSVADAATLFGSGVDDPFASILGSDLGGIDEQAEEKATLSSHSVAEAEEDTDADAATPKVHSSILPETQNDLLHPSTVSTTHESSMASSPSALFPASTSSDFFSGTADDSWQNPKDETQQFNQYGEDWSGGEGQVQNSNYYEETNGLTVGQEYNNYEGYNNQYENQQQYANGYGVDQHTYDNATYQQGTDLQAEQYGQYESAQGQYDPYAAQQPPEAYDATIHGYGQQGDGYQNGYQQDGQVPLEQQNQYELPSGQYDPYNQQQQAYDPVVYGYEQEAQQYPVSDPSYTVTGQEHDVLANQVSFGATGQENETASAAYPGYDYYGQEQSQPSAAFPVYDNAEQEAHLYTTTDVARDKAGSVEPPYSANASFPADDAEEVGHQYSATNPSYDFGVQHEGSENLVNDYGPPIPGPETVLSPYDPVSTDGEGQYGADPFNLASPDYNADAYSHEHLAGDETIQHEEEYTHWAGTEAGAEHESNLNTFGVSAGFQGDDHQQGFEGPAGYFDNVTLPPVLHTEESGENKRSLDVISPYDPPHAGPNFTSIGQSAPFSHDRAVDVAEERHRSKIPLASFSIDGKLLTFFPTWSPDASEVAYTSSGVGYSLGRSSAPTKVTIRPLHTVIPATTYASSKNPLDFPGPALGTDSSQGNALSRATGANASSNKAKKTSLINYLTDAATEMASGIGYLTAGKHDAEARRMQDRILILRILIVLLEQDGNLINNAAFDSAVKNLLLSDESISATDMSARSSIDREPVPGPSSDQKARFLNQIEGLVMAGQRKEAVDLAVQEKMWTHAVVIASGMDRQSWRDVVAQFVADEFDQATSSHQGLKVAYHLFSGQEPKTTYDLFRPKTSLSSNSTQSSDDQVSVSHAQWRKSVATILANRTSGDSAILTAIGDGLKLSGWIEASHVCYMLSPTTSSMEGYDGPSSRVTLFGAHSPEASTCYLRDLDHIILTEVFEYALSLQPVAKGAEAYHGLAFLQPYRLVHAYLLAEMGDVKRAVRYCDSIMTLLKHGKMNRYYHPVLLHQLQELSNRLQGDTKSISWTKKKPTMDGVWSALEGRFTKFIAGEDDGVKDNSIGAKGSVGSAVGPFSHYSAITPDARSGGVSRVHSTGDFKSGQSLGFNSSRPQSRAGSAVDSKLRSGITPLNPSMRSASEYSYGDWTPPAHDSSGLSSPKYSIGRQSSTSDADMYNGPFTTHATMGAAPWYDQEADAEDGHTPEAVAPSDMAYYGYQPHGASHPQFISNVDQDLSSAMNGASIDDSRDYNPAPNRGTNSYEPRYEEDDEDLGFGNKTTTAKSDIQGGDREGERSEGQVAASSEKEKKGEAKPGELKPAASWFGIGRFWNKGATSESGETKAKKAHLGEEVSFYYDKDLKRWINKKAGDTSQTSTPPPAPPRAQTASPSGMKANGPPINFSETGPRRVMSDGRPLAPPSPSGSSSLAASPGRDTPPIHESDERTYDGSPVKSSNNTNRTRSNLADLSQPAALQLGQPTAPSRPGTMDGGGPPRTASGSVIKKKPISKRYVRVD